MCDIEKMFHQVKVNKECRDYLRFLWWEDGNTESEPAEFRMTVHLFGAVSSPGCANFGLKKAADDFPEEFGNKAAEFVKEDFYVDDGLKSVPSVGEAIDLIKDTKALCEKGGFRLHKFISNSKEVIETIPQPERADGIKNLDMDKDNLTIERALGVQWCVESDTLQFRIVLKDRPFTRRGILATVSSVFDPLGLVAPVILLGKRILQSLCHDGVDWDERIPDTLRPTWERWRTELHALSALNIDRCYKPRNFKTVKSAELHHFSDASNDGYGQCSYLRLVDVENQVHCSLVMSKSRVTPRKPITIPRLELSAALVSVKVSQLLRNEMNRLNPSELFWTDSKVVLGYINNEARRFHIFVANRVQQIRDQTSPHDWHYVETSNNPADDASRGLHAQDLVNCNRWWNGPEFLWNSTTTHPPPKETSDISMEDPEVKKVSTFATKIEEYSNLLDRLEYFSDWHRAKRSVAVIIRYQRRFKRSKINQQEQKNAESTDSQNAKKGKREDNNYVPANTSDILCAEREMMRLVQNEAFQDEVRILSSNNAHREPEDRKATKDHKKSMRQSSSLYRLDPFLDKEGLLRVGGRLRHASLPYEAKHPVIVPRKGHVTSPKHRNQILIKMRKITEIRLQDIFNTNYCGVANVNRSSVNSIISSCDFHRLFDEVLIDGSHGYYHSWTRKPTN
ncbi:hypothetical protein QZH41_007310 [Actinostola sp. cb2023]|nr:hypothetical protein QZH41_007310 [Actinostola sp. cb2023]